MIPAGTSARRAVRWVGHDWLRWLGATRRSADDARIAAHLRRSETALRSADVDRLAPDRRRRRERALDTLAAYRRRGEFPTNASEAGRSPLFVGSDGTPCAMAALALADGREDLVDAVMASEPAAAIEDLPEDHPLVAWIESTGLTRREAARVQPTYPEAVDLATTCGPVSCRVARLLAGTVGVAVFAALEFVGYRTVSGVFPDNALKRRSLLAYLTVANLLLAPLLAVVLYSLFP